ncbi:hypothetical protein I215_12258 [Galbibacter marinus]|uniref:SusD/RagB family nutrient-binding outer membrane lipoprotein n=2 Tax=Galbibacter marinus TaxID=555500 RepID=K2P0C6_9FLAO|nr:hypothetical protein I215_12258 [Galbibacter marinus]
MKKIFKTLPFMAILGGMIFATSCDSDFEEINTDPDRPTVISEDLQLGAIERTLINRRYDYFLANEAASNWVQHTSQPVYNDADRYFPRTGSIDNLWIDLYINVIADADEMYRLAEEAGNPAIQGTALTLKAVAYQTLTDVFGNIPFSEANKGLSDGNYNPKYDSQRDVYAGIFELLDEAIAKFNAGGTINSDQDLIYGGNISKWIKFATSVKFRAMMRVSDTDLFSASAIQSMIASGNLITSVTDNAFISYTGESSPNINPVYGIALNSRQEEWCVGESLVEFMKAESDPRLEVYAEPNPDGEYIGKPAGYLNPETSGFPRAYVSNIGDHYMASDAELYFINAVQVNLLIAEAIERFGASGDAATYFQAGIDASLEQNGLEPGDYTPTYNGLQSIGEQLWVGTFMQGYESYAEWRRTDIPANLPLAIDPQPGVGSIPTRFTYPNDEVALNGENVEAAIAEQGEDKLTTKIWWDKN